MLEKYLYCRCHSRLESVDRKITVSFISKTRETLAVKQYTIDKFNLDCALAPGKFIFYVALISFLPVVVPDCLLSYSGIPLFTPNLLHANIMTDLIKTLSQVISNNFLIKSIKWEKVFQLKA